MAKSEELVSRILILTIPAPDLNFNNVALCELNMASGASGRSSALDFTAWVLLSRFTRIFWFNFMARFWPFLFYAVLCFPSFKGVA